MFSVQQKRDISDAVQKILRATHHAELPATGEISFLLHVDGAESWSFADIFNNAGIGDPGVNPHNERMASISEEQGRELIRGAQAHEVKQTIGDAAMPDPRATAENFLKEMLDNQIITLKEDNKSLHTSVDNLELQLEGRLQDIVSVNAQLNDLRGVNAEQDEGVKQLQQLVTDLNNGMGSIQNKVNDLADEIKKIKGGE